MLTSPQQSFAAAIPPRNCNLFRPLLSSPVLSQNGTSDLTHPYTATPTPNPPSTKHTTSSLFLGSLLLEPLLLDSLLIDTEVDDPPANSHKPSTPTHSNVATAEFPPTPPTPPTPPSPSPESSPSAAPVNKLDRHDAAVEITKDIAAADGVVDAPVHAVLSAGKHFQHDAAVEITKDIAGADGNPSDVSVHAVRHANAPVGNDEAEIELEVCDAVEVLVAGVVSRANAAIEQTAEVSEEVSTPRPKRASSAHLCRPFLRPTPAAPQPPANASMCFHTCPRSAFSRMLSRQTPLFATLHSSLCEDFRRPMPLPFVHSLATQLEPPFEAAFLAATGFSMVQVRFAFLAGARGGHAAAAAVLAAEAAFEKVFGSDGWTTVAPHRRTVEVRSGAIDARCCCGPTKVRSSPWPLCSHRRPLC